MARAKLRLASRTQTQIDLTQRFISVQDNAARIILTLPYEILHAIFQHLDSKACRSLLYFPGNWRDLALEALLYSIEYCANPNRLFVCPSEFGDCITDGPCPYPHRFSEDTKWCFHGTVETVDAIKRSTHVRDVGLLLELLQGDRSLSPLIRNAYFKREPDTVHIIDEICRMLDPASLLRLHFSGTSLGGERLKGLEAVPRSMHIDFASPEMSAVPPLSGERNVASFLGANMSRWIIIRSPS